MNIAKLMLQRTSHAFILAGAVTLAIVIFMFGLDFVIRLFYMEPLILMGLPLGALILDYLEDRFPKINSNIEQTYELARGESQSPSTFPQQIYTIGSTWLCHLFGASVGRESVAVQTGGGLANYLFDRLSPKMTRDFFVRLGIAGAFAVTFGLPATALFFSFEVGRRLSASHLRITKQLIWETLFTLPFAWSCHLLAGQFGLQHDLFNRIHQMVGPIELSWKWLPICFLVALISLLSPLFFPFWTRLFHGLPRNKKRRVGALLFVVLVLTFAGLEYTSLGVLQIESAFTRQMIPQDFLWKLALTSLCVSVFLKGGDFTPLLTAGATLGGILAHQAQLPLEQGAALAFACLVATRHKIPITGALMTAELFGWQYALLFVLTLVLQKFWLFLWRWLKQEF